MSWKLKLNANYLSNTRLHAFYGVMVQCASNRYIYIFTDHVSLYLIICFSKHKKNVQLNVPELCMITRVRTL